MLSPTTTGFHLQSSKLKFNQARTQTILQFLKMCWLQKLKNLLWGHPTKNGLRIQRMRKCLRRNGSLERTMDSISLSLGKSYFNYLTSLMIVILRWCIHYPLRNLQKQVHFQKKLSSRKKMISACRDQNYNRTQKTRG